ncbi:putative disease resistance protein [Botrytis fragariae]|uniref:Putative gamma-glutamylcyclotransferase n=1 Tax=Botrytis fragariae TaxID=1964551 RepID=A0A8H6AVR8_9HELO|nr:putative disease resistance protein [Botrytis fragariae]KAF5874491.1 putative disease resistance protein [Botrytis fragariae]
MAAGMDAKTAEPTLPETYNAFFYGTLMAPEVLYRVIYGASNHPSTSLTITPALLHDYCRHRVSFADYPAIISEPGHTVRGTYVTGLTPSNMRNLDYFEGSQYERKVVTVKLLAPKDKSTHGANAIMAEAVETGEEKEAQTYVFTDLDALEKGEWDFEFFRREKLRNWADESEEYAEVDAKAAKSNETEIGIHGFLDQPDPTGGRGIKTAMGKELKELTDKKREEEWILEEKKRIARERSKCQCTIG